MVLSESPVSLSLVERLAHAFVGRPSPLRVPSATYRLQFHAGFTFDDACRLIPYLHSLGVSDVYASPYLRARSGSSHGYDVADPNALNPEIGEEAAHARFVDTLRQHQMGHVLDVVPNHMGIGDPGNSWWTDVLENGRASIYAPFFDINWEPAKPEFDDRGKVILPVLGDQYGTVLENGELSLVYADGAFELRYYQNQFPIAPDAYSRILAEPLDWLRERLGVSHPNVLELESIITAVGYLPGRASVEPDRVRERNREKEIIKGRLDRLHRESAEFREALDEALRRLAGRRGEPRSFDALDELLSDQAYRLAYWRVAAEEINYRRFFDVSELAAVRMEALEVFHETHKLLLRLVEERKVTGIRLDHPDGLWDPGGYFWHLQQHCFAALYRSAAASELDGSAGDRQIEEVLRDLFVMLRAQSPDSPLLRPLYVVVEKILSSDETLDPRWPVAGTTGYDFLNDLNGIYVDRSNRRAFDKLYQRFILRDLRFGDLANSSKKMIMLISLASEVNELGHLLKRIASRNRRSRDFTLNGLTFAIREVIASLPVYRTYIDPSDGRANEQDRRRLEQAVADAKRRNPRTAPTVFEFVRDTLLLAHAAEYPPEDLPDLLRFVAKFQQATGPVMAKGVEDTAFYNYNRLVSLNEVGGEPDHFGIALSAFHRRNAQRVRHWPHTMLTTSTHDTKRSEDVRARINVLSEMPRDWSAAINRWNRLNARKRVTVDGSLAPDRNEEYLLYQTLIGVWPAGGLLPADVAGLEERVCGAMLKSLREAKANTSWISPNEAYEQAVLRFVRAVIRDEQSFRSDFEELQRKVAFFGRLNSLSQTAIKLTAPGMPDVYQGNELWDYSLVDPDNRRPVDYALRVRLLAELLRELGEDGVLPSSALAAYLDDVDAGRVKLYLVHRCLKYRRAHPELFGEGGYLALHARGSRRDHLCSFARTGPQRQVVVAAPVLIYGLTGGALTMPTGDACWRDTVVALPREGGAKLRNLLTGETVLTELEKGKPVIRASTIFARFPVALLERAG